MHKKEKKDKQNKKHIQQFNEYNNDDWLFDWIWLINWLIAQIFIKNVENVRRYESV